MTRHLGPASALSAALMLIAAGCDSGNSGATAPGGGGGAGASSNSAAPKGGGGGGGLVGGGGPNAPAGPPSKGYPGAESKDAAAAPAPPAPEGPSASASSPAPAPAPAGAAGALTPENTKIEFVGTKADGQHTGGFGQFTGSIAPSDGDFAASKLTVEINTESLTSDNPMLTNHLKAPDFFEVKKYPKASFVSKSIKAGGSGGATHTITGDLTLHGTTKTIDIPAKVTATDDALTLESKFEINRLDYGIAYQPQRVNPTVTITVKANVKRK